MNYPAPPKQPSTSPWAWVLVVLGSIPVVVAFGWCLKGSHEVELKKAEHDELPAHRSIFARPEVMCRPAIFSGDTICSITVHHGAGNVCWKVSRECDGLERIAERCSGPLDKNSPGSFTVTGAEFTPPVTRDMQCTSFKINDVRLK